MIGLQISEAAYLRIQNCGDDSCQLCDKDGPAGDRKCNEQELYSSILKEQKNDYISEYGNRV